MRQISNLGPYQTDYFGVNGPKRGVDERGRDVIASHLLVDELGQLGAIGDNFRKYEIYKDDLS